MIAARKSTPQLRWVSVIAGCVSVESQVLVEVSMQKPPVKVPPSASALQCGCKNLCCTTPTWVSRFGRKFLWEMMKKPESSGWRRGGEQNWLTPGKWSFTVDMSRCGHFWALAAGTSTLTMSVSLGSTRWSSRMSCVSCLGNPAGVNKTIPFREDIQTQLLGDSTHSGGRGSLVVPWAAVAGPSRAAHPSDSCWVGLIEIAARFESPEVLSAMGLSPDRRLPHIACCCMGWRMR